MIAFKKVPVGDSFFDPKSREYFLKQDDYSAEAISGGDAFQGESCKFDPDEEVEYAGD